MLYQVAIQEITSSGKKYINLGLDRIQTVLESFENPQDSLKCIHIAGTNGKGSVCAILNAILQEQGYKIGMYTSPHIFDYTERIQINSEKISEQDFADYFKKVKIQCEALSIDLTEFEIITVIMFLYFKEQNVDYVILETGLGGRFDATNIIKKNVCSIITHIDLDHTDLLGDTKEKIAYEKAGIIKENCSVVTCEGYEVIKDKADELNSLFILASPYISPEILEALSLKGLHQQENLALALACINYAFPQINDDTIISGLQKVKNPFRFQYFKEKNLIIDACHNPNGIEALRENLDYYFPNQKRRFVFGCLNTKNYEKMMNLLFKEDDEIYLCEFNYPNSCSFKELASNCPYSAQQFVDEAILTNDKLNIICGSFYMIGEICKKSFQGKI